MHHTVLIDKLVHGGQALGVLPDGRKVLVWNALPGETVNVRLTKSKSKYAEGIAEEIVKSSPSRIEPIDQAYLSTSPWQIMTYEAENEYKKEILKETFVREKVNIPGKIYFQAQEQQFHYRNKMEYSFWGDDDGLHLALHNRGSHQKQTVDGSTLAMPAIDTGANSILNVLPHRTRAGDLKTIVVRCSQDNQTTASLFVKRQDFYKITLPTELKGLRVYYSNPKSPAAVRTSLLYELGDSTLTDTIQGVALQYDTDSFFQVNVPVFDLALGRIRKYITKDELTDMYCGVGSIGLCLAKKAVDLIESDPATAAMARINAAASSINAQVIEAVAEKALEFISSDKPLIIDPPRAGLHPALIQSIKDVMPPKIVYLSCNPSTHARDIALLQNAYKLQVLEGYNFFPRTPHIESLAILELKASKLDRV